MRNLTLIEIGGIMEKYPGARKIAVTNFLITVAANRTVGNAYANLDYDARLYNWSTETLRAIKYGIGLSIKPQTK